MHLRSVHVSSIQTFLSGQVPPLCLHLLISPERTRRGLGDGGSSHRGPQPPRPASVTEGQWRQAAVAMGKTWALRHKDRKHSVLFVLETFISRVNNNSKLVYCCEFHCLPLWGSHLLPLFRFCAAPEHREASLAAGMGGHCLLAAGRAQAGVPGVLYHQHGSCLGAGRQARSPHRIIASRC